MSNQYSLLVFDWDGTLMDSPAEIVHCFQAATHDVALTVPTEDEIRSIIGLGMREAVAALFPDMDNAGQDRLIAAYREHWFSEGKPRSDLFEGVYDMLHALEEDGFFLAVATSKGRRGLNKVLAEQGLDKLFHTTICVDEAHSKPHPQMLLEVMDRLGQEAAGTLMIGDTEFDLQMAVNAGVDSVAVSCGAHPRERLLETEARICLHDTRDLRDWLHGQGKETGSPGAARA